MAFQLADGVRRSLERWVALAVIVAGTAGCEEARESDLSAYERPPGSLAESVRRQDAEPADAADGGRLAYELPADDSGLGDAVPATDSAPESGLRPGGRDPSRPAGDSRDPRIPPGDAPPPADPGSSALEPGSGAQPSSEDGAPSRPGQAVDVDRLLRTADEAYANLPSLRARFHQVIDVPLLERRREGYGTWYQKGRSRFKMDFDDPPEDEIVADGTFLWLFYPSTNPRQVIRSRLGSPGTESGTADVLARILEEARTNYDGQYVGSEAVDGVATHVVSLRPTTRSQYRLVRVWIAKRDRLVRRFEITEENETVRTVTLSALEPGAVLPDSLFRFVPPADADVFEG